MMPPRTDCIYYWREKYLYAIRCDAYKAHFITRSGFNTSDPPLYHNPPLLYNIEWDASESIPIDTNKISNKEILLHLETMANIHIADINNSKPKSLYLAQNFSIMPCCPRANMDLVNDVNGVPRYWEKCVCNRPGYDE